MNPYTVILSLFIAAGMIATLWGGIVIARGRKTLHWPSVTGTIEASVPTSKIDDLLPHIEFSYSVSGKAYQRTLEFPTGITPTPEFTASYMSKFPVGASVEVYYDPQHYDNAILEPGPVKGDWLIFILGFSSILLGIVFLFFGGT